MILQVKHISKAFGDNHVLDRASLSLEFGQVSILMGANGSGKTTLFNIISGFLKPDAGEVYLSDKLIQSLSPYQIARIGFSRTFQDMRLISKLSVRENILLAFSQQRGEAWWRVFFSNREEENRLIQKTNEILKTCFIERQFDLSEHTIKITSSCKSYSFVILRLHNDREEGAGFQVIGLQM